MTASTWIELTILALFVAVLAADVVLNRHTRKMLDDCHEVLRKAEALQAKEPKRG